jgi:penicillin-binding protein 1B
LEIAGAYTSFVNRGVYTKPALIRYIREASGKVLYESKVQRKAVMDPRVAYLMTNIMESVIQSGTGAGVRGRGFTLPAAGKTGTSHDGWFAGFTSRLICVVWVGFDDNRELKLEGAHSALPVWTAFMKRAHQFKEWRRARPFEAPDGIVSVEIDPVSGQLAGPGCVSSRAEVFITGTQPIEVCRLHGGGTQIAGWEPVAPQHQAPDAASPHSGQNAPTLARSHPPQIPPGNGHPQQTEPREEKPKKRGLFGRIADLFK